MLRCTPIPLLLALVTLVISQDPTVTEPSCPTNQQLYQCKPCPELCGNVPNNCTKICEPGCSCSPGYVKQTRDSIECIPQEKCITCQGLQVFSACRGHCPPSCEAKPCTLICRPGCICKEGYLWHNGTCIPESQCLISTVPL
ncbi:zonadhesin-like [Xenopus laevis]|uniref:Zonadhesin-like n=1 Tax=Xenopus laevis TaxID=8355 RepID=A0A8J1LE11_XENLA|nr:zonadhesin-like [Xenopus laevis]XP_041427681.1 zonadhesin-like [Xenopus laevis]